MEKWVAAGFDLAALWPLSPREIQASVVGRDRRDARQAWLAAQYARYAYHQPNDMPPDPGSEQPAAPRVDPDVARQINEIRLRVKLAQDATRARRQHGS